MIKIMKFISHIILYIISYIIYYSITFICRFRQQLLQFYETSGTRQ